MINLTILPAMGYSYNDIDKILEFKTWSDRRKVDELLRIDSSMYCNTGTDSTVGEMRAVHKKSRDIYKAIEKIDKETGALFLRAMDK